MSDKKNARPSAGTLERAEVGSILADGYSRLHDTILTPQAQGGIAELLSPGRENAISRRDLETMTGLNGRTVRLMIQKERLARAPILADNSTGYFLPESEDERAAFVRSMRHRAGEILRTAEAVEGAAGRD